MNKNAKEAKRPFFKKTDIIIVAFLLALVAGGLLFYRAQIYSQTPQGIYAVVSKTDADGIAEKIYLNTNDMYFIDSEIPVTLEVENGAIRFINSQCPDHVCEGFGWLKHEGDWAFCAPAGVMVRITE